MKKNAAKTKTFLREHSGLFRLISLSLMLLSLSNYSFAYDFKKGGIAYSFYYLENGRTLYVSRDIDNPYSGSITIPAYVIHEGYKYPVTAIGQEAFYECENLVSVTIPNSVTSIGLAAFASCSGLKSVSLSNSLKIIGKYAFSNCKSLRTITIPNSVTTIEDCAFEGCSNLTTASVPKTVKTIGIDVFNQCPKLKSTSSSSEIKTAYFNRIKYRIVDDSAKTCAVTPEKFVERNGTRNLYTSSYQGYTIIPEKVKLFNNEYTVVAIDEQAFRESDVTQIELPNTIKTIGLGAFYNASKLSNIEIPASVTEIGPSAFEGCRYLDTVVMGDNVTKIGSCAFFGCVCLTTVKLSNKIKTLEERTFTNCNSLKSVNIPTSLNKIGDVAFGGCDKLTSLTMPATLKTIGENAFYKCKNLEIKGIPATAKIAPTAFDLCKHKYNIVQKKYSAKYGAALVAKVVGLFKNEAHFMDCPIGTPLVLLQELGRVMHGEDNIFLTQRPYNEYVIGNNRYKHYNFNGVRMIFKNGKLTDKSDWRNI
ncbi:MAG: leucine-rich repeat domain-containing protein [Bacteroidales bacterium]|nr:leucine-rich repeat domain-containing protein [Bacteroidales bacterium]